jgi:hypothetical protein
MSGALHWFRCWRSAERMSAISEFLDVLSLKGAIVTI